MEVIVGKHAGFCEGVKFAVQKTEEAVNENKGMFCLGEVVHNKQVIETLESKGLKIVNDISEVPDGEKMIIRAHGEREEIYDIAKNRNIEVIDTTCGNVKLVHNKVKKAKEDSFILVIGEKGHPEVLGTIGFAGNNSYVIEDEDDILDAYIKFETTGLSKVYAVAQTTFSSSKFDILEKDKTICNATETRQDECEKLAKQVDYMIVIGGKNSANTKKLVQISEENCKNVLFIQTAEDLKNENFDNTKKVGIMAGASTPSNIIDEVKKIIEKI
jgi:4-hydroxy-3-methylbut-2-enyl diphosphate reductase